jgi:hypothetical protein
MLASEILPLDQVGHCPFCGRFFDRREGHPSRWMPKRVRGRFGTQACWKAWRFDQEL